MACSKFVFQKGKIFSFPNKIYLDTNVLISSYLKNNKFHVNAEAFIWAILFAKSKVFLSPFTFNEAWWIIINKEFKDKIQNKGVSKKKCANYIKMNKKFLVDCKQPLEDFRVFIDKLTASGFFEILDIPHIILNTAYSNIFTIPLMPTDSCHYAIAAFHGIDSLATCDDDFNLIPDSRFNVFSIKQ